MYTDQCYCLLLFSLRVYCTSTTKSANFSGLGYGSGSDDEGQRSVEEDSDEESEDESALQERIKRKRAAFERKMKEREEQGESGLSSWKRNKLSLLNYDSSCF